MKLALVVGSKTGETLKTRLMSLKDNLEIDVFEDVPYFIDITYKRNIIYNRILITATLLNDMLIKDIHTFWTDFSKDSQIVVLGKKGRDDNLVRNFMTTFQSTMMGSLLVPSTNVMIISEACFQPVQTLNEQYGISDFLQVDFDTDNTEDFAPEEDFVEEPEIEPQVQKSGGIIASLMGTRTQVVQQPQQQETQDDFYTEDNGLYEEQQSAFDGTQNGFYEEQQGTYQDGSFDNSLEQNYQDGFSDNSDFDTPDQSAFYNEQQNLTQYEEFNSSDENLAFEEDASYEAQGFEDGVNTENYEEFQQDDFAQQQPNITGQSDSVFDEGTVLEDNNNFDDGFELDNQNNASFESTQQNQNVRPAQNQQINTQSPRRHQQPQVEDDFNLQPNQISQAPQRRQPSVIDEINEDLSGINLGQSEQRYKQAKEQPKVIVQEVIKNVGTISGIYDAVRKGTIHKTIIVTGDRCTGVTLTALNIAKTLSATTPVLFVDFDSINHGSLTYLDYSIISDFEQIHLKGTKVCKNSQIFKNCTISYDKNLDLLLSDYSETVTYDDIADCARVLAERALDYTVVVIDCPIYNIKAVEDLLVSAMPVICVEGTKRGFMNMICSLDNTTLEERVKRLIATKAEMLITKCSAADAKKWLGYMKKVYQPDGNDINWMNMRPSAFNGKLNEKLMNRILEG